MVNRMEEELPFNIKNTECHKDVTLKAGSPALE
jgi:hypothetical protein